MKHLKLFGLLAAVATATMAFAAIASATTVTNSSSNSTPTIHAASEEAVVAGTKHVLIHNDSADIECNSTLEGKIENAGGPGLTAVGNLSFLNFSLCTGGWSVTVNSYGSLEFHTTSTAGHGTATLTSSGATITAKFLNDLITCRYKTENTHIGTVTGGTPATLHITAKLPFHGGSGLCGGESSNWTGAYKFSGTLKFD